MTPSVSEIGNSQSDSGSDFSSFTECQSTGSPDQWGDEANATPTQFYQDKSNVLYSGVCQEVENYNCYTNSSYQQAVNQASTVDLTQPSSHAFYSDQSNTPPAYEAWPGFSSNADFSHAHDSERFNSNNGYKREGAYEHQHHEDGFFSYPQASFYPLHSATNPEEECFAEVNGFTLLQRYAFSNVGGGPHLNEGDGFQTRVKTNLRKRERNLSINKAFEDLRGKIPNLPSDTKVSKIKVLRLAAEYIKHLSKVLQEDAESSTSSVSAEFEIEQRYAKRSRDEFKIDPNMVSAKRRKTDWNRIQEEITRHKNVNDMKKTEKSLLSPSESQCSYNDTISNNSPTEWQLQNSHMCTNQSDLSNQHFTPLDNDRATTFPKSLYDCNALPMP